ncbi:MAG TPA: TIGR03790 family protein, partial [Myxococcota bacterium]
MHRAAGRLGRSRRRIGASAYSILGLAGFHIAALLLAAGYASASTAGPPEIVLVVNDASAISRAIGAYYAARRGVPAERIAHLSIPVRDPTLTTYAHETISRSDFERAIRAPLEAFLRESGLADRIEILVTTKGVPLRILEDAIVGEREFALRRRASVDAELALLFTGLVGSRGLASSVNPYFRSDEPF